MKPALIVNLRGTFRVKPQGGEIKLGFDPGVFHYLIFMKVGEPSAIALCKKVERRSGDWIVEYECVKEVK